MYQSSISSTAEDQYLMEQIGKTLFPIVQHSGGILVCDKFCDRPRINIACNDDSADKLKRAVQDVLAERCSDAWKEKYIKKQAKLPIGDAVYYNAYLQALVSFDRVFEKNLLKDMLPDAENLMLDGVYHFRIGELKERWDEICALAQQSGRYLLSKSTYLELLRFLVGTIDSRAETAKLFEEDGRYTLVLTSSDGKVIHTEQTEEAELAARLIEWAPSEIQFEDNLQMTDSTKELLVDLFPYRQ